MRQVTNIIFVLHLLFSFHGFSQDIDKPDFTICRLKYSGGGDWYNDRSIIPNILKEFKKRTDLLCAEEQEVLSPDDRRIFYYPILFMIFVNAKEIGKWMIGFLVH